MRAYQIYETGSLDVSAKGDVVAIEVLDGHWHETLIDRDQARVLAEQLLAWCNGGGDD